MIDLTAKGLPDTIKINGKPYLLNTDFREWIKFGSIINNSKWEITDITFLVQDITLYDLLQSGEEFVNKIFEFYINKNSTPNVSNDSSNDILLDYGQDGEYIIASFMQAYHIDLTVCDMHWHLFQALFRGLPDDTIIKKIMGYRGYIKSSANKDIYQEYKQIWSLNNNTIGRTDEDIKELEQLLYGAI